MEELRYQHTYHPERVEQKSPALARVLDVVARGLFGDENVYEPYVFPRPFVPHVAHVARLLNTIQQGDYYLITDDFESCASCASACARTHPFSDIEALSLVDQAYEDRTEWIKKSIRTTAKVGVHILLEGIQLHEM